MNDPRPGLFPLPPVGRRRGGGRSGGKARHGPARCLGALFCLSLLGSGSCSGKAAPPGPGQSRGRVPDLRGRSVLVLPIQRLPILAGDFTPDEELAFALKERTGRVRWVFFPEVEDVLSRSPGIRGRLRDLPMEVFLHSEVKRIGDPLFGELRRLTALVDAELTLIPLELCLAEEGRFSLKAALLTARDGRVHWFGVVEGGGGGGGGASALAAAAEALARAVVPIR